MGRPLLFAALGVLLSVGQALSEPRLRGIAENREGVRFEGWIRFERDKLLLEKLGGGEIEIAAGELDNSHMHLAGQPAPKVPKRIAGLRGSYFRALEFGGGDPMVRTDPVVDFDWAERGPMAGISGTNFSVRWTGEVETLEAGKYRFHTSSNDGLRLWVDGRLLIDQWVGQSETEHSGEIELAAGRRLPLQLEYFQTTKTAAMHLLWTPPGGAKSVIPAAQLSHLDVPPPRPTRNGLRGSYFKGVALAGKAIERTDGEVNFRWTGRAPLPGFEAQNFSVRWEGEVEGPIDGEVTFRTITDDGVRLWVGGRKIIDVWSPMSASEHSGTFPMQVGRRYPIRMEYYQDYGDGVAMLSWSGPSLRKQIIPASRLFSGSGSGGGVSNRHTGLLLKGGSFLAGEISGVGPEWVDLTYRGKESIRVPRRNVGALVFKQLDPTRLRQLETMAPGCVLPDGDYFESTLTSFEAGSVSMVSALFGRREFAPGESSFIKLADFEQAPANFELHTKSGSRLRADWLMLDGRRAVVKDNSICWIKINPADVAIVHGLADPGS